MGMSGEKLGLMSGICARSLIVFVLVDNEKSAPLHFAQSSEGEKNSVPVSVPGFDNTE